MIHNNLVFKENTYNTYKIAILYTKLELNLWNMTLNCKDLSFYIKNRNFIIQKKLRIFLKNSTFSHKSA